MAKMASVKTIRQLTDSLQEDRSSPSPLVVMDPNFNFSTYNNNNSTAGTDHRSQSSDGTSLLYRYGHEIDLKNTYPKNVLHTSTSFNHSIPGLTSNNLIESFGTSDKPSSQHHYHHHSSFLPPQSNNTSIHEYDDMATVHSLTTVNNNNNNNASKQQKNLKFVSGSQFRMLGKLPTSCTQCDILDKTIRKQKETIRSLKVQINRMEESFKDLKFSKAIDSLHTESKTASDFDFKTTTDDDHVTNSLRKLTYLEDEVTKLKKLLSYERNTSEALRQSLEEVKTNHIKEIDTMKRENEQVKYTLKQSEHSNEIMQRKQKEDEAIIIELRRKLAEESSSATLRRMNNKEELNPIELMKEIEKLRKDIEKAENNNKTHQNNLSNKNVLLAQLEAKISDLTTSLESAETMRDTLQSENNINANTMKTNNELINQLKKRIDVVEALNKSTITERDTARTHLLERELEVKEKTRKLDVTEKELAAMTTRMNDLLRRMTAESETTRKALEKAITASVKLCVVAPTVNVHVSDNKLKFKSRLSEAALKQFLTNEIFDRYSFLYKQSADGAAPTGEGLESWLQKMLSQMQRAIENHVNSAMEGSSM